MVRIIAGEYRSRQLLTVDDELGSRPYLDRVKESVFGMLHEWFQGARVLDLFAGVGTVGLEAVSRGAASVLMVEKSVKTFRVLRSNIEALGCGDRARALLGDALGPGCLASAPRPCELVFCDPPFELMHDKRRRARVLEQLARCRGVMAPRGYAVLRSPLGPEDLGAIPGLEGPEAHRYTREMWVLIYQPAAAPPDTLRA
jgi:16S rRNA (guanine(966)-N(2))-methyltransferase RsmD